MLCQGFYSLHAIGAFSIIHDQFNSVNATVGRYANIAHKVQLGTYDHPYHFLSSHNLFDPYCRFADEVKGFHNFENTADNIDKMNRSRTVKGGVHVGNDVWIGQNVIVLPGVRIGDGAVIAAGAVVTKNVPPYAIVGGVPAKIIKYRFTPEQIDKLVKIKWWDYQPGILSNCDLSDIDSTISVIEKRINEGYPKLIPDCYLIEARTNKITRI